jgi:alpha-beta hydrolase superfamily lysophospholipase
MKRILLNIFKVIVGLYILVCAVFYFFQERLIFLPEALEKSYQFDFEQPFEEHNFKTADGIRINGLLFRADSAKGLIFYLHGNEGSLKSWGNAASTYTDLDYDFFILDYRGYGKSEGKITNHEQLFQDNQMVYDELTKKYDEKDIIILGYSIGSGMASALASENDSKRLILQAPYYSLTDLAKQNFPFIPSFTIKYKFATNEYLKKCKMPVTIIHGNADAVIPYESSLRLKEEFDSKIELITLDGLGHNGLTKNEKYKEALENVLEK